MSNASMVVSGKEFNRAMEEINASYAVMNKRIAALEAEIELLKNPPKPETAAEKKKREKAEADAKAAAEAELEKLSDIANR